MFQLGFLLRAHGATILTPPGTTELHWHGNHSQFFEDDELHSAFQAADQHFCAKYDFLARTIVQTEDRLEEALSGRAGTIMEQFASLHDKQEGRVAEHTKASGCTSMDIADYIEKGENPRVLEGYRFIRFPTDKEAAKYYFTKQGSSVPETSELSGNLIILLCRVYGYGKGRSLIRSIQNILDKNQGIRAFEEGRTTQPFYNDKCTNTTVTRQEATEELHYRWDQDPDHPGYHEAMKNGLTKEMIGNDLTELIWNELPVKRTVGIFIGITREKLMRYKKNIECDDEDTCFGPYGAAIFLLSIKDRFERLGTCLQKKTKQ